MIEQKLTWVIKFSKYCNLRCSYCYEFPWLNDRFRIPIEQFESVLQKIRAISLHFESRPQICWHGGEPLLLPRHYLTAFSNACNKSFADGSLEVTHSIQTNLSILTDWHINFLQRQFGIVGVSFDPFGHLRNHVSGTSTEHKVLKNADRLRRSGVRIGCISVLTQQSVIHIDDIFNFFNESQMNFRILPYYRSSSIEQAGRHGLTAQQTIHALTRLFDLWLAHGNGIVIEPLDQYLGNAISYAMKKSTQRYNKEMRERVLVINTDGSIYAVADTYDDRYCYGNIFSDSVDEILTSAGRKRAILDTDARIETSCKLCCFRQSCSGWYAGEATDIERDLMNNGKGCGVPLGVIHHIYSRLRQQGVWEVLKEASTACMENHNTGLDFFA